MEKPVQALVIDEASRIFPMDPALPEIPFELELLSHAHHYQKWIADTVAPFLGESILEVGAGLGNMSRWLPVRKQLTLTEASQELLPVLGRTAKEAFRGSDRVKVQSIDLDRTLSGQIEIPSLDTIISFNVMEHILDDAKAMGDFVQALAKSAAPGPKRIVSFVPAHAWAMGSIDRAYGHYRRYSRVDFEKLVGVHCPGAKLYTRHFNLFGLPGWFVMGRILQRTRLGLGSVKAFEWLCPNIRNFDDFLHERLKLPFGQSLLSVITLPEKT